MKARLALLVLLLSGFSVAKDAIFSVVTWPNEEHPFVRFTFSRAKEMGSAGRERSYAMDVVAENLWNKPIKQASFDVYFVDKSSARISTGHIYLNNVALGETVKFQMMFAASGTPVSMKLAPDFLPPELGPPKPPHTVSITINSSPQGAVLKVDGKEVGATPQIVELTPGKHDLEIVKEGFTTGHFPFVVGPNDASGGTVNYELGTAVHDTIELRDGSVITGDLQEVTATTIRITVGGSEQIIERNKVKRIVLIQRGPQ